MKYQYNFRTGLTRAKSNTKRYIVGGITSAAMFTFIASPAGAAPSNQAACRQGANDLFVTLSTEGTRGDFMSDVVFGNEPNMANGAPGGPSEQDPGTKGGNVVPTQSPGPFVNTGANEPPRNDRTRGATGGDVQAAVKAICNP